MKFVHIECVCLLVRTGPDRYQKHSFIGTVGIGPFNCWSGSYNRLLGDRNVLTWLAVELSNSRSTEWYWNGWNCLFIADRSEPKIKWSVPINEHTHIFIFFASWLVKDILPNSLKYQLSAMLKKVQMMHVNLNQLINVSNVYCSPRVMFSPSCAREEPLCTLGNYSRTLGVGGRKPRADYPTSINYKVGHQLV
jgi:hypothetical protein